MLVSDFSGRGGIQSYMRTLSRVLVHELGIEVHVVSVPATGSRLHRAWHAGRELQRSAAKSDVVVVSHSSLAALALFCRLAGGPPYVVLTHGIEIWRGRTFRVALGLRHAAEVWAVSRFTATQVRRLYPEAAQTHVVWAAIQSRFFQSIGEASSDGPPTGDRILTVSRLDDIRYKGIDVTLDALRELRHRGRDALFFVIGDGPERALVMEEARRKGLADVVECLGDVTDEELEGWYRKASVFVLVSRFKRGRDPMGEGLGLATVEAAAAGVPVIVSNADGAVDTVDPGITGLTVAPGDPLELAEALAQVLSSDGHFDPQTIQRWTCNRFSHQAFAGRVSERLTLVASQR